MSNHWEWSLSIQEIWIKCKKKLAGLRQSKLPPFLIKALAKLKQLRDRKFLFIEFDERYLKIVELTGLKKAQRVTDLYVRSIEGFSDPQIVGAIKEYLSAKDLKPQRVIFSHPSYSVITHLLKLPSVDDAEIADIVSLQAIKQTPYSRDEVTNSFAILKKDDSGYSYVLSAISQCDIDVRYVSVLELAGLPCDQIIPSVDGSRLWYEKEIEKNPELKDRPTLILSIDQSTTDLLIYIEGQPVFLRTISYGAAFFQDQTILVEEFYREVERSIETAFIDFKEKRVEKLIVFGGERFKSKMQQLFKEKIQLEGEYPQLLEDERLSVDEKVLSEIKESEVSFTAIIGAALNFESLRINLLPEEVVLRKGFEKRARDLVTMGCLVLALVTAISAIGAVKYFRKTSELHRLEKSYELIENDYTTLERLVSKMKLAKEQLGGGHNLLNVFYGIVQIIPDDIYFTSIKYDERDANITFHGVSEDMSSVFHLLTMLEETSYFEFVKTRNVKKSKVKNKNVSEFEIVANIETPKSAGEGGAQ